MIPTLTDPVREEEFFGRADLLAHLRKRVKDFIEGYRQNVAILGRRSVGKSSLIHRLLADVRDGSCILVHIEIRPEPFAKFVDRWITAVTMQFAAAQSPALTDLWEAGMDDLVMRCPPLADAVVRIRQLCNRSAYSQAFEQLLRLPILLSAALKRPPLIVLESFEHLNQWSIEEPFAILGRQIMVQPETMFLVTSATVHDARRILSERFSLLFGNFEVLEVPPFDLNSSCQYLRETVSSAEIPQSLAMFLAELTGGTPFYLRILGRCLGNLARERDVSDVHIDDIAELLERTVFDADGVLYHYCTARLQEFGAAMYREPVDIVLAALEQRRHRFRDLCRLVPRSTHGVAQCVQRLVRLEIAERSGGFAYLADPLWGLWKCHVHQPRDVGPDGDLSRMAKRFRSTIGVRYERFKSSYDLDPVQRIQTLLRLFRRDLVHVNHYDRWLVPFETVIVRDAPTLRGTLMEAVGWEGRWISYVANHEPVTESFVGEFIAQSKRCRPAWHRRIVMPLIGIDENAVLLAKAEQVWVWPPDTLCFLLRLYGQAPLFVSTTV